MPFFEAVVYLAYTVIDNAYRCFYGLALDDEIIDGALFAVILGGFFQASQDEDIEIGYVFVCDMTFGVDVFDPFVAGIAAEEDNHVCRRELFADYSGDEL